MINSSIEVGFGRMDRMVFPVQQNYDNSDIGVLLSLITRQLLQDRLVPQELQQKQSQEDHLLALIPQFDYSDVKFMG